MVAEGAHAGRRREGAAGPPRGGGRPDPRLEAGDGRGGHPPLRREGGLGPERALHGRARGHDRAGRLAAPLRDPRRARQGDLPPAPAPRRRRAEDWSRRQMSTDTPAGPGRERRLRPRDRRRGPPEREAPDRSSPASRRSRTATSTSATPSPSASTSASPQEFGGRCHLRFDDTNPTKEEQEYVDAIEADVRWLGFDWGEHLYYASDYFEQLYEWAVAPHPGGQGLRRRPLGGRDPRAPRHAHRARAGTAPTATARSRRTSTSSRACATGEFPDGARVLRAKIDMASGNINLRDPVLYRILHATHPRTGDAWCIYPTYDFAHGQSDAIEGITHSICTLEFEDHRPLYDWFLENLPGALAAAAVRVRPAQPQLHRALEALPAEARERRPRARLGRPAHAHDLRHPPPRLPGRGASATSRP